MSSQRRKMNMSSSSSSSLNFNKRIRMLESHQVRGFLSVRDVSILASVSRNMYKSVVWREIFRVRWPEEYVQVTNQTGVSGIHRSDETMLRREEISLLRVSASYFWQNVEDTFLQANDVIGAVKSTVKKEAQKHQGVVLCRGRRGRMRGRDQIDPWRLACALQERGDRVLRCRLCGEIDVCALQTRLFWEPWLRQTTDWVVPCACDNPVHRLCAERRAGLLPGRSRWFFQSWDQASDSTFTSSNLIFSVYKCEKCGEHWKSDLRLPSATELFRCAVTDHLTHARAVSSTIWYIIVRSFLFQCLVSFTTSSSSSTTTTS